MRTIRSVTVALAFVVACLIIAAPALAAPGVHRSPPSADAAPAPVAPGYGSVPLRIGFTVPVGTTYGPLSMAYPSSFDLRTQGRVTSVKDQNPYGTCWSFAADASMESCLLPGETWDFSEDNMTWFHGFDPAWDEGGNSAMATAYLTRWDGPFTEAQDGYADGVHPAPDTISVQKHVQDVVFLPQRTSPTGNDDIKYALTTWGAVDVSIYMSELSSYWNDTTDSYYSYGAHTTNHDVTIVGWDDAYPAANFAAAPGGDGAFLVKNSWGTGWGDAGYFWISYYDSELGYHDSTAVFKGVEPATNYGRVYQWDPYGFIYRIGYSGTTWGANRFVAQADEQLEAVGFWTLGPNTSYAVHYGTSLGGLQQKASGTFTEFGYHTLDLPAPVSLSAGAAFYVAVSLSTPGTSMPLAQEGPDPGYCSAPTASSNQSFYSSNGLSWTDMNDTWADNNACIKAYTSVPAPSAPTVTSPNGGQSWIIGSSQTVTWSGAGAGTATIALSRDGGASYGETLVSDTANDGSYSWTVTGPETTQARVRVTTDHGNDASDGAFTIAATPSPGGWSSQVSGTSFWLNDVCALDQMHGVIAGWSGTILGTTDGGTDWLLRPSATFSDLKGVAFGGAGAGWAVGRDGTIVVTHDGGQSWAPQVSGTTWTLDDVDFVNLSTGWAVGLDGVFKTMNGGGTWKPQRSGLADVDWLRGVDAVDRWDCWAVGDGAQVYRTRNGGLTWTRLSVPVAQDLHGVCAIDRMNVWAVGAGGAVVHTGDGGATWQSVGLGTTDELNGVCFVGSRRGWIVGEYVMFETVDGGATWRSVTMPASAWLQAVDCYNETSGWAVGLGGKVFRLSPGAGDETPPETSATGVDDLWYNAPVTVYLEASDASGVAGTECGLDDTGWRPGTWLQVPADPSGVNDGVHLVEYRSTDTVGNVESYHSLAVRIDTLRPRTKAASAPAVRRNRYATLKYSVNDGAASAGLAVVTIKVKTLSGRTVRTLSLGTRLTGRTYSAKVKCTWAPRTYRYYVYATDPAGNKVLRPGSNKLVVRR